jgi:hypothetical protein
MTTQTRPPIAPASPIIDSAEIAWATAELAALVRQADPESVVGAVLKQTLRELYSLVPTTDSTVVGPIRFKTAA